MKKSTVTSFIILKDWQLKAAAYFSNGIDVCVALCVYVHVCMCVCLCVI